ncbi:MAG: DUF2024 family protein [Maribacter sp.]|uniref:DUF2024 family protein n=1 Tax=Maribacter sp. TaxID=1897614 RepID=UPI003C76A11E
MKVSVWDTYVHRKDGRSMHFDILVPSDLKEPKTVFGFGNAYLIAKSVENHSLTTKECRFCHIEHASEEIVEAIAKHGFAIIEMENCD